MEGTPFGRYRLISLLGRGGMGEVWRAHDTAIDRTVALKVLPAGFAEDQLFQQRFRREAKAAARLDEPHVVPIHDFGEIDGRLFVTMRLIKGRDLQEVLRDGPLPPERAVKIVEQIASALHAAHEVRLVHRDVKPSNILVAAQDFAYLIDFGIARAAGETGLTSTGATIGTWAYMAPERFQQGVADARADIYALACVLYQALTAQLPFPATALEQIAVAHMMAPPPRPSEAVDGIPGALDAVIATGMAKNPDDRYPTTLRLAQAALDAIRTPAAGLAPVTPPPTPTPEPTPVPTPAPPPQTDSAVPTTPTTPPPPVEYATVTTARPPDRATRQAPAEETRPAEPPTDEPVATRRLTPWWRRKTVLIPAAIITLVAVVISLTFAVFGNKWQGTQTTLGFVDLDRPAGVAVGGDGTVYITDTAKNRVVSLAAGATSQTVWPFSGLRDPAGVAVGGDGTVYVADNYNNRVVSLAAGATSQTVLPFTGLNAPDVAYSGGTVYGVAVGGDGTVYAVDYYKNRVLALAAGATSQTELPFTGLNHPSGVAVAGDGTVYVADNWNDRVVALAAGAAGQTVLPFTGLDSPSGVAVGGDRAVYVVDRDNERVAVLAAGATRQTELPLEGLREASAVAVAGNGTVYVADNSGHKVVSLVAG